LFELNKSIPGGAFPPVFLKKEGLNMNERTFIIRLKTGNKIITESEAIANAEEQKAKGIKPHYVLFDGDKKEKLSNPGWLIWSTWEDGAGVVVPRDDGKLVLLTGWQSNLAYC
jgi:hypothetical protein